MKRIPLIFILTSVGAIDLCIVSLLSPMIVEAFGKYANIAILIVLYVIAVIMLALIGRSKGD